MICKAKWHIIGVSIAGFLHIDDLPGHRIASELTPSYTRSYTQCYVVEKAYSDC